MRLFALLAIACLGFAMPATADDALPFSPYVERNGTLYVSGHLPFRPGTHELHGTEIATQTHRVIGNIEQTLHQAGLELSDVVNVTVFLTTMEHFAAFNAAYVQYFPGPKPARTTVAVQGLAAGALIEMNCIAVRTGPHRAATEDE